MSPVDSATAYILIMALVIAVILLLLGLAWRGRQIGERNHCGKCSYLLAGLPESSDCCPECGTTISQLTGRKIGYDVQRRSWMGVIVTAGMLVAAVSWEQKAVRNWFERPADRKPTWLLIRNANGHSVSNRRDALIELQARDDQQLLTGLEHERVIDATVRYLATPPAGPDRAQIWFIEQRAAARVSDANWKRFFDDQPPDFRVRPIVSSEEPFCLQSQPYRSPRNSDYSHFYIEYGITSAAVDGVPIRLDNVWNQSIDLAQQLPDLSPGKHELQLTVSARIVHDPFVGQQWIGRLNFPIDFRRDGSSTVKLFHDDIEAETTRRQIHVKFRERRDGFVDGEFACPAASHVYHDAYLRVGQRLERLTTVRGNEQDGTTFFLKSALPKGTRTVDIVLRPNRRAAAATTDVTRLIDAEMVLEDIPVIAPAKP